MKRYHTYIYVKFLKDMKVFEGLAFLRSFHCCWLYGIKYDCWEANKLKVLYAMYNSMVSYSM